MLAVVDYDDSAFSTVEPNNISRRCITIRSTSLHPLDFKIRSTHPERLLSSPSAGNLDPGACVTIEVVIDAIGGFDARCENPRLKLTFTTEKGFPSANMDHVFAPFLSSVKNVHKALSEEVASVEEVRRSTKSRSAVTSRREDPTNVLTVNPLSMEAFPEDSARGAFTAIQGAVESTPAAAVSSAPPTQVVNNPLKPKSEKIRVVVRVRPSASQNAAPSRWTFDETTVSDEDVSYVFNRVLPPISSNVDSFNGAEIPQLVRSFVSGFNVALLMYGQTNSGKTHTMFGSPAEATGVIHCVLRDIFRSFDPATDTVTASMLEIYNEEVRDLLVRNSPSLKVVHVPSQDTFDVESLSFLPVQDAAAAILALNYGMSQGSTGPSHLNARSSRAHTIFRLNLRRKVRGEGNRVVTQSSELCFVDLAGSESLSEESNKRETHHINLSLAHLKRAIVELSHRKSFVSFRSSALTKLLKNSLQSNSRTVILCTINLDESCDRETRSTLIFGTMAKSIQNAVRANIQESFDQHGVDALRKENDMLRMQLVELQQQLSGGGGVKGPNGGADAAAEPMQPLSEMSIISPLRVYGPTVSDFAEYLESEGKLSKLLAHTLLFLQSGCLVSVLLNSSARLGVLAYKEQMLHLQQLRGGEIVAERGLRISLTNVAKIVLGRRMSQTEQDNSWRRRVTLNMASGHSPTSSASFSFQCKTEEDFEAWVVCLSQLAPHAQLTWDPLTMRKHRPPVDQVTADMLSDSELVFCQENNVDPIGFVAAKNLVKSKGPVSLLQLRTSTNLTLFDANVVCEHFVQRGLLRKRTVLSSR